MSFQVESDTEVSFDDQAFMTRSLRPVLLLWQRVFRHKTTLTGEGWDEEALGKMGLDCYTHMQRSSLGLDVQDDMVFILSQSEHGPGHGMYWNVMEG